MALQLAEFMALDPPKEPMLIGRGILPAQGKMIIGGPPKANKSFVAINIALSLAAGKPLFEARYKNAVPVLPVQKPATTLYIEQEIGQDGLQTRLRPILDGISTSELPYFVKSRDTAMRLDVKDREAVVRAEIEQVSPQVVIFDPLSKFHLQDENSSQEMGLVMRIIDHLIEDYKCAVILVHHIKKPNAMNPAQGGDRLRGSSAIFADVDTLMEVDRLSSEHAKEPILKISFELRRGEPIEPLMFKRERSGRILFMGEDYIFGSGDDKPHSRGRYRNV